MENEFECVLLLFSYFSVQNRCVERLAQMASSSSPFLLLLFMIESFVLLTLSLIEPSAQVSENSSLILCEQRSHFTGSMLLCLIWKKFVYVYVWVFMCAFLCVSVHSYVHICTFLHVSVNSHVTCLLVRSFLCVHAGQSRALGDFHYV